MIVVETTKKKINIESSNTLSTVVKPIVKKHKLTRAQALAMHKKARKNPNYGKHGKRKTTLAKEEVYKEVQRRLAERALKLIDTQTIVAHGTIKIYKITTHYEGSGKSRKKVRDKPKLVTNEQEIERVIDSEFGDGEDVNTDDEYFFINTQDPDNKAIESQLNRVFGKAPQKFELPPGSKVGLITGMQIITNDKEVDENGDPI